MPAGPPYILDPAPLPDRVEVVKPEVNPWLLLEGARAGFEVVYYATEERFRRSIPQLTIPGHDRLDFRFPVDHINARELA